MPSEFDPETAMGLFANIPAVEAAQAIVTAKAVAIAFGDAKLTAHTVFLATGDARAARNIEIQAAMRGNDAQR